MPFQKMIFILGLVPMIESVMSISGGLQLFVGLFAKDDIHSWTGAHALKVNFRGFASVLRSL